MRGGYTDWKIGVDWCCSRDLMVPIEELDRGVETVETVETVGVRFG